MEPLEWSIAVNSPGRDESEWAQRMRRTAPNRMDRIEHIIDYVSGCPYHTLGAPGEVFSYSNEGYAILSYVVDAAAGVPLEQFMAMDHSSGSMGGMPAVCVIRWRRVTASRG